MECTDTVVLYYTYRGSHIKASCMKYFKYNNVDLPSDVFMPLSQQYLYFVFIRRTGASPPGHATGANSRWTVIHVYVTK